MSGPKGLWALGGLLGVPKLCAPHGRHAGKSKGVAVVQFAEPEAAVRCKEQLSGCVVPW